VGALVFWEWPRHRRITLRNLEMVFGDQKSKRQLVRIGLETYQNEVKAVLEVFRSLVISTEEYSRWVTLEGEENLKRALAKGRGVIAYTAHFGNFAIMGGRLFRAGYNIHILLRAPHDPGVRKLLQKALESEKMPYLFDDKETVVQNCRQVLRQNGILFMAADQYASNGVEIEFLGLPTLFTSGPVVMASRSSAALVPMFITRLPDERHAVSIEPEVEIAQVGGFKEKTVAVLGRLTGMLESRIREHPSQWLWLHRRWKNLKGGV